VLAAGSRYLRIVGPFYGFFGAGLALYFASQGAGRLLWPLVATFTRLVIAGVGGWLATRWVGGGLTGLFAAMALALVTFGMMNIAAVRVGSWRIAAGRRP
jgi:Na+-driven multidrug efflux pump